MATDPLTEAFGPAEAATLRAHTEVLAKRWPAPDTLLLASTLVPRGWGVVRKTFELLRQRKLESVAAIPHLVAWLQLAPRQVGVTKNLLTGWEAYALSEGWWCAAELHPSARRALDVAEPGPVARAVTAVLELCDDRLVPLAIGVLEGPAGEAQRGAVAFLGTARAHLPQVAAALVAFASSPAPDDASASYARGEALSAYESVRKVMPAPPLSDEPPPVARVDASAEDESLSQGLGRFRRLVAEGDATRSRQAAREWLRRALPATEAADMLREQALAVLAVPEREVGPPASVGASRPAVVIEPFENPVQQALLRLAAATEVPAVRIAALESLIAAPDPADELSWLLVEAAADPDPSIREVAARLLGQLLRR